MGKQCKGCGAYLQNTDPMKAGYITDLTKDFCVRCYRLNHYGDTKQLNLHVEASSVLNEISLMEKALYVWVIDIFHLEASQIPSLKRWLNEKPVIVIFTKRELLPLTMSQSKLIRAVQPFLKQSQINVADVIISSKMGKEGKDLIIKSIKRLKDSLKLEKVVFFGQTNAGKSTLLNTLFSETSQLSVSAYPGTTLDLLKIDTSIGDVYDSPGIDLKDNILNHLPLEAVKLLQPKRQIKPITYQLMQNQSLIIAGLAKIDFLGAQQLSVTAYFPESVEIHRTKVENSTTQFERAQENLFSIADKKLRTTQLKNNPEGFDLVIDHIGFFSIKGKVQNVSITCSEHVSFSQRKVMI